MNASARWSIARFVFAFSIMGSSQVSLATEAFLLDDTCPAPICRVCVDTSPAQCFDVPNTNSVSCGQDSTISHSGTVQFTFSGTYCGVGASASYSRSVICAVHTTSGDCERCYLTICYPHATFGTRTCTRYVPDRWTCESSFCECVVWRPTSCHEETTTTTIINPGTPDYSKRCEDNSCDCKHNAHRNCACASDIPPGSGATGTPSTQAVTSGVDTSSPNGSKAVNFAVAQLANKGSSVDSSQLNSLDSLTLAQLGDLRNVIEDAINSQQLVRSDTEVVLKYANGSMDFRNYAAFASVVTATQSWKVNTGDVYDVNADGVVDNDDLFLAINEFLAAQAGGAWMSRADVNGDNAVNEKDICDIARAVAGIH